MSYILNCTQTPNHQLPAETIESTKPLAIIVCKAGFTEKASAEMVKKACADPKTFVIKDCLIPEPKYWTINGEENETHFVEDAMRKIFSNHDMAFGSGVVILDTSTRIGKLLEMALKHKGIKTLKKN